MSTLQVRHLGRRAYPELWTAMRTFTDQRDADTADELWIVEHDPVFTLGQAGKWEHVLMPGDIPVIPVDRGGQVTYHGPGQIVAYPLLDLRRQGLTVRGLVTAIEQALIDTCATWAVRAQRRDGAPGVYVDDQKIAALGLRIRRGYSYHGLAFNIDMDLEPFARINPCGYAGLRVTDLHHEGGPADLDVVAPVLIEQLRRHLGYGEVIAAAALSAG